MSLERLYDEHAQAIFSLSLNLLRNEADARDVLQDVFVKLARQPSILDNLRNPRGFFLRQAHNLAIDLMRRRESRERNHDAFAVDRSEIFAPPGDPGETEFAEELSKALGELPADQRTVAHLKLWEKLTFEEIASTLEISTNTAASRYRYAIDKLRERLRLIYDEIQ